MRRGHTLIELLTVTTILAVMVGLALPPAGRWRDAAAVRAARDDVAGRLAWTRVAASYHGGAVLVLDVPGARYRVELPDGTSAYQADLRQLYGVSMESAGVKDTLLLRYDGLGIGRTTGGTLRFRRGGATAGLTVTPYGRYRRW
jgi:prepilin-type N-terminal cleavage/methylation domain-containing protein